jgi:hypothetical protein
MIKFHYLIPIRGQNNSHPIERVRSLSSGNSIKGDLAAYQVDEKGHSGPDDFFFDLNLSINE